MTATVIMSEFCIQAFAFHKFVQECGFSETPGSLTLPLQTTVCEYTAQKLGLIFKENHLVCWCKWSAPAGWVNGFQCGVSIQMQRARQMGSVWKWLHKAWHERGLSKAVENHLIHLQIWHYGKMVQMGSKFFSTLSQMKKTYSNQTTYTTYFTVPLCTMINR